MSHQNVFLMAEDDPADAELFSEMLAQAFGDQYTIVCVDSFAKISQALDKGSFHALILDMNLPDQSGIENVSEISSHYPGLPIVVLTGHDDLEIAVEALQEGAQDYLAKNKVTPDMLARSLKYAKERKLIEERLKIALNEAAFKNIQLERMAKYDSLTNLPNRMYLHEAGSRVILRAARNKKSVAFLFFDLNGFKKINDTYGHAAGDELLRQVSLRLEKVVRETDFLARIGGDEFVIITDLLESKHDVYPLLNRIEGVFEIAFKVGPHEIPCIPSIGVAFFPDAENLDLLMKHADCAMYEAKANPQSNTCFYSGEVEQHHARVHKIELSIASGIENNLITALFQPVRDLKDLTAVHVEVLARWHDTNLGMISPTEFIPIAEATPAINGITKAMTHCSKDFVVSMASMGHVINKISINISPTQLGSEQFSTLLMEWLEEQEIPTKMVCLELTERQVVKNFEKCKRFFDFFQSKGITIALDDFGSGYSSITHLLELPFNTLKMDRFLIDNIDTNPRNQALVAGIVEMAHRLDMTVVAEGVERKQEYDMAQQLGCDYIQGYYISRPLPIDETVLYYSRLMK